MAPIPLYQTMKNKLSKHVICCLLIIICTSIYLIISHDLKHLSSPTYNINTNCINNNFLNFFENLEKIHLPPQNPNKTLKDDQDSGAGKTHLRQVVFGIAGSANLWHHRKNYIKTWWRPGETRGFVWLDKKPKPDPYLDPDLPSIMVSSDFSRFSYKNKEGDRSGIRLSRIVSETVRLGLDNVRWIVMGDDDTVFFVDNLIRVLEKYDYREFYYIGSNSESHHQNLKFSYNMGYGGGGFAISYGLAKEIERMQDGCLERYPYLYGSDDRIQACMAELGVPLTKQLGFHQLDIYGNAFGLLAAHPIAPLVSLHHLDKIKPIFPDVDQVQALERLMVSAKLDSAGLMQQSICYDTHNQWTISVSWGYAVQIFRHLIPAREIEKPQRTFVNWYPSTGELGFAFNTRPVTRNGCEMPLVYVLSNAFYNPLINQTASEYTRTHIPRCKIKRDHLKAIHKVRVYKKPDPHLWDKAPRRNCCKILSHDRRSIAINVTTCGAGEVTTYR